MRRLFNVLVVLFALCVALGGTACTVKIGKDADSADTTDAADSASDQAADAAEPDAANAANTAPSDPLEGINADSRVVAVSRSVGELWTLAGGSLVGVTEDAQDLSPDATVIGTITKPNLEQILALDPDLIMLTEDLSAHRELHENLSAQGKAVLVVDINSFEDYAAQMSALTTATGRSDLYAQNVEAVKARIDEVIANSAQPNRGSYLALRTSATKNKVLKADNFACAMLDDMGLTNVADDTSALDDLSLEAIAEADPDWIFVVYQGETSEAQEAYEKSFQSNPVWGELSATKAGHVVVLPKDLFQYKPNARWGEAYAYLSQVLHGAWA